MVVDEATSPSLLDSLPRPLRDLFFRCRLPHSGVPEAATMMTTSVRDAGRFIGFSRANRVATENPNCVEPALRVCLWCSFRSRSGRLGKLRKHFQQGIDDLDRGLHFYPVGAQPSLVASESVLLGCG